MAQNLIYPAETKEIKVKELTYLDTNRGKVRNMSVQHTNLDTSQDKAKPDQEFNNQELVKKNSPDNGVASILLAVAFYLAIVYLALFLLLGLSNPWGIVIMIFLAPNLISFIIATILTRIGRKKVIKTFYTLVLFFT